ncbi:TorF family putative porin [Sphingobium sp. BYY-5]|uniref:TorF family putative porin n=1 Tax=Sphingobium sp. BYY-5 TaxID=2926400 RepID=UPI001FA707CD|nr:TorF family putative porin [Sphingobium sp. BYY-5]MCI4590117.1 TorF family putative porin [Sphingobium sp. BYY-5]
MFMKYQIACVALALLSSAPAFAQEAPASPITVSGSVALVSDYRFRGVSQTDKGMAIQGGITATHESGAYVGTWGSNLAGWGTFGGSSMELDLFAGYAIPLGGATLDVGLTWYMYPSGADKTDFAEPYVKLSSEFGPVKGLIGVAYAPKQEALGKWYNDAASIATGIPDHPGAKKDNFYVWGDVSGAVPNTPVSLKAHLGWSKGNSGLGPNGTSIAPTGKYLDWLVGADVAIPSTPVTAGIAYVGTNISRGDAAYLWPNFADTDGSSIAKGKIVFSLSAAF